MMGIEYKWNEQLRNFVDIKPERDLCVAVF
jgi:hypothetical protein